MSRSDGLGQGRLKPALPGLAQRRYVGAKGELLTVAPEQSGLAKPTKLVVATDVSPLRQ